MLGFQYIGFPIYAGRAGGTIHIYSFSNILIRNPPPPPPYINSALGVPTVVKFDFPAPGASPGHPTPSERAQDRFPDGPAKPPNDPRPLQNGP